MSMLLRKIARYAAQKAASSPEAKEMAVKAARGVVQETKQIVKEDDRAYAAGKAVRRAYNRFLNER